MIQAKIQVCKTHQPNSLNVLQRTEQVWNNYNMVCPPSLQNPIQACTTHQSFSGECPAKARAVLEILLIHV